MIADMKENRDHTIKDFLERRRMIESSVVAAGGAPGDRIYTIDLMDRLLNIDAIKEKINGFFLFRADVELEFLFAASPQVSGGFIIYYAPDISPTSLANRTEVVRQISQFPMNIINISTVKNFSMKAPFISPMIARNLMTNQGRNGTIGLHRLVPTTAPISVTVWARFTNIHLEYPTRLSLIHI